MTQWIRRVRGTIGMGLTWAVGWAVAGVGVGALSLVTPFLPWERFFAVFDAPLPAAGVPGFFAGVFFSVVLGVAGRHRRLDQLSVPRVALWGGVAGLALGALPFLIGTPRSGILPLLSGVMATLGVLCAGSAAASLAIAQRAERLALQTRRTDADAKLDDADPQHLLAP